MGWQRVDQTTEAFRKKAEKNIGKEEGKNEGDGGHPTKQPRLFLYIMEKPMWGVNGYSEYCPVTTGSCESDRRDIVGYEPPRFHAANAP